MFGKKRLSSTEFKEQSVMAARMLHGGFQAGCEKVDGLCTDILGEGLDEPTALAFTVYLKHFENSFGSYVMGFGLGYAQGLNINDKDHSQFSQNIIQIFEYSLNSFLDSKEYEKPNKSLVKHCLGLVANKLIESDEYASEGFLYGLSDGKSCVDTLKSFENDYSAMDDARAITKVSLPNFQRMIVDWATNELSDESARDNWLALH